MADNDNEKLTNKTFLGDGVYVEFDGYYYILTAENGSEITDKIYIDRPMFLSLLAWAKRKTGDKLE